jgi:capsular polysaccharide biosynthesis protein
MTMGASGFLPLVRRWRWLLGSCALGAALVAWVLAATAGKTYEAEAKLLVGPVNADYPTLQASGALGRTYAELAHSRGLVEAAAREADVKLTREQVDAAVTASSNDVTRILDVRVRYSDPEATRRLATALAAGLIGLRRQAPAAEADPVEAIMREPQITSLSPARQRDVRAAAADVVGRSHAGDLHVIQGPVTPRDPVSPRVTLLVLLAALAGALVAATYVIVREGSTGLPAGDDPFEDFEVESFLPSANGSEEPPGGAVEQWLDEARGGGRA